MWNFSLGFHDNTWIQNRVRKLPWAGVVLYWGTTPRSLHLKITARSNWQKTWLLGFFVDSKSIWGADGYYKWLLLTHYWSGAISPSIARGLYAISALEGDYHLGIPLTTHLSQSWSESTKLLKCSSVEPQPEPPWQHKCGYRIGSERSHELVLCFTWGITPRSPQGHIKVTGRSNW